MEESEPRLKLVDSSDANPQIPSLIPASEEIVVDLRTVVIEYRYRECLLRSDRQRSLGHDFSGLQSDLALAFFFVFSLFLFFFSPPISIERVNHRQSRRRRAVYLFIGCV